MTPYDFTTSVDRRRTGSIKWGLMRAANPDVPAGIMPFSTADLDFPVAPEIRDGLIEYLRADAVLGYTAPTPAVLDAIVAWMRRRHAWTIDPEHIVVSPGVIPAFTSAIRTFTDPGDAVLTLTPAYPPFFPAVTDGGRVLLRSPLVQRDDRWELDLDDLAAEAGDPRARLLLLCSPHNPTGRVWSRAELEAIARIVVDNDLLVISDEIHADLIQPGHEHTVFANLGGELGEQIAARAITCMAPSKTFNLAGMWTSASIVRDDKLRARLRAQLTSQGIQHVGTLGLEACRLAYTHGEPWLAALLDLIGTNHRLLRARLAADLPEVGVPDLEGTYLAWLDFRALAADRGLDTEALVRACTHDALVFFDDGRNYGPEGEGFLRMNLGAPTTEIDAAIDRLVRVLGRR